MGSRAVRVAAVVSAVSAVSVVLVGCAGGADVDPSESPLVLPSAPSQSATPSEGGVLDLESMSDEELLAEAKRAYQGFIDDAAELQARGGRDYLSLDTWAGGSFLENIQRIYADEFPEEYSYTGAPEIQGLELDSPPSERGSTRYRKRLS